MLTALAYAAGAVSAGIVWLARDAHADNEMYRRGYERAVEDARARRRERDLRAARRSGKEVKNVNR
jgi:glycine/D-amino acid oxidase-like deaminating enzyme